MVHSKLPTSALGKVSQKKSTKKCGDSPNRGRGGHPEPNSIFKKRFFQGPHSTILGHPKHVLHLVLSHNAIAKAFNVMECIGMSALLISDFGLFWANVN